MLSAVEDVWFWSSFPVCFKFLIMVKVIIYSVNMQFVNNLHALISPTPQGTPLPLVLLGKVWMDRLLLRSSSHFSPWWPCQLSAWYRPKMHYSQLSFFLIKLCGLVERASIRYRVEVSFFSSSVWSILIFVKNVCKTKLRCLVCCRTRSRLI